MIAASEPSKVSDPLEEQNSLADRAHAQLEELIATLDLAPGSVWSEQSLSELLSIGRTPVREAIKRLEMSRLIQTIRRHGIRIADIDIFEQLQAVELRSSLEALISAAAARRASSDDRRQLATTLLDLEKAIEAGENSNALPLIAVASRMIMRSARNPYFERALGPLLLVSRRFYLRYAADVKDVSHVWRLHAARARAVAVGDVEGAEEAAYEIMAYVEQFTRAIYLRDTWRY
jgi:DNA-binding GntR family transcriptional regulator